MSLLRRLAPDESQTLQVRLFRLVCVTVAVLSLAVVAPANVVQHLPWGVHVGNVVLGLAAMGCWWASGRGRHYVVAFFLVLVGLFDLIWFLNAGSDGSLIYYFFPAVLYPAAIFQGRLRVVGVTGLIVNVIALLFIEQAQPDWVVPFQTSRDRLIDLTIGAACSMLGLAVLIRVIVSAHEQERRRIGRYADELAAGEANYRAIFDSTSDALFIHGADGRTIDVNQRACELFGFTREQALRLRPDRHSGGEAPYAQADADERMRRAMAGEPQVFRWRSRRASGELFWSEVALRAADISGQRRLIASVRDIGARVQAEEALHTQQERLQLALAASDQGWFDLDLTTGQGTASAEYARIIGREPVDFTVTAQSWLAAVHPEDRPLIQREFEDCVASGETHTMEYRRRAESGEWKWIRSTGRVVAWSAAGRPVRMIGTHADITERKRLQLQLLHSQRLESVGTLAGGVAHDLNNILTPMLMVGPLLREKLDDPEDRAMMEHLEAGAKRGAAIVRQLLAFSRDLPHTRVPVDVAPLIREMLDIMRGTFPREIEVAARLPAGLWPVTADPIQLHQVLMNLCINARDAMPKGGRLELAAANVALREGATVDDGPGRLDRWVELSVADTGEGIRPEIQARIFDPFFTTKDIGKGTGLGLSVVHGIVKSHGGAISLESEPGQGSRFKVLLPASAVPVDLAGTSSGPGAVPAPLTGRPLVLLIDDELSVLQLSARILEQAGCEVVAAHGPGEALGRIAALAARLRLIVTDMMMPGMDGATLVARLRGLCPGAKVIGASGLNFERRREELAAQGFAEMLRKPYDAQTLLAAVRRHLGEDTDAAAPQGDRSAG